jgi:hypothetical protein
LNQENLVPKSKEELARALKGFWDKDLSVPGGGNWGSTRKSDLVEAVKASLRRVFEPTTDEHALRLQEQALQFESTLRMALTEDALFELKQGFCQVNDSSRFDDGSFEKILKIASAMANVHAKAKGVIFSHKIDKFCVTGTQHELDALGRSVDEQFRWLVDRIKSSKLEPSFASSLAGTLEPFRYRDYLLWKLEPEAGKAPVTHDGRFYVRSGPSTDEVTGAGIIDLVRRFPAR